MPILLSKWNSLIAGTLNPANGIVSALNKEAICELIGQSAAEAERVKADLIKEMVNKSEIGDKHQYIQLNQAILIHLLDKLHFYTQCPEIENETLCLYKEVNHHLKSTLDFIEKFFNKYFDYNERVPAAYLLASINDVARQLEVMKGSSAFSNAIEPELTNILIKNFEKFCSKTTITYNELSYQKELMNILLTDGVLQSEKKVKEILFCFNFNDSEFIDYLYSKLRQLIEASSNQSEKITVLRIEQKNLNQLAVKRNSCLSCREPSVKEQVNQWIEEEVKFFSIDVKARVMDSTIDKAHQNVHTIFKGPEIYLLHKAFVDSGGAPTETYKSLLEKTSPRISNKNQKGFSAESLKKASDKLDPESKENVKKFLQRMIRNIDSYD